MSDEIKDMLRAVLGRLDEQGAGIKGINERLDRQDGEMKSMREEIQSIQEETQAIRKEMATKADAEEIREDIRTLIEMYGEHNHEIRKLKRKVKGSI